MQINHYLFKRVFSLSLAITGGLVMIMLTIQIISKDELLIHGTVNFAQLVGLSMLAVSEFLAILLVIGFASAVHLVRNQLANDNELVILKATGFSNRQLLKPYYAMLLLVTISCCTLTTIIVPELLYLHRQYLSELKNNAVRTNLASGRFFSPEKNLTFYIGEIDFKQGRLYDIYISDYRLEPGYFLTAQQGQFFRTPAGNRIKFTSGSYHYITEHYQLHHLDFQEFWYDITQISTGEQNGEIINRHLKNLRTARIIEKLLTPKSSSDDQMRDDYQEELHKRFNLPLLASLLAGFLLLLPISPLTRQRKSVIIQYGIAMMMIGLIVAQASLMNIAVRSGFFVILLSYIFPVSVAALPFFAKEGRKV